ncbi:MAG TPA: AAA family ATPase [Actinophytocola sp.]|uniref:AAA family ATPase n=1 Tax=Actinophytocola sp. TaxID=1872138 RepID=UPI002DDD661B|nr:AAA family ATPase [Actinophytocola sp.]HEV2784309.1 AAA family ATPase [Actinophytocola sp.]
MGEAESVADLARLLRRLRRQQARRRGERELTYREIAARTGWAVSTVGEYFTGRTLPPTDRFDTLLRLLEVPAAEQGALATARDRVEERRRAADLVPGRRAARPAMRLAGSPTVGRDAELDVLGWAIDEAGRGRGGAVFLLGEAGLGKTRLLREAERAGVAAGAVVLRGRSSNPSVQFRPLAEALFSVLRKPGVPDEADLTPYRSALSRLVPEWRVPRLPGADDSLVVLAEGVLRLCARLGRGSGCLVLLDDLHEADGDTLAVVDYLVDNAAGEGVLVVGTVRAEPSAAVDLATAAGRRGDATVLGLSHLDAEAVRELAAGCLGVAPEAVPADVLGRLISEAEGNPFYVEELLAGMVGNGRVVRSGDGWSSTGTVRDGVPPAVRASVLGRVERLGPLGLPVLRAASLLGQRFDGTLAGAIAMVPREDLLAVLRAAVDARLVVVDGGSGGYAFRHALTAEALRSGLLPEERTLLARRAAGAIEAAHPELPDPWCVLAGELWERAGEKHRAAELFGRAGRRAVVQGAVGTAIALLERGLALLAGDGPRLPAGAAELLEALLDVLVVAGQVGRAIELGVRLDTHADPERRASVHLRLARAAAAGGQWATGQRELELVRSLLGPRPTPPMSARVDAVAAQLAFADPTPGRLAQAEELAARALRAATEVPLPEIACESLEVLGTCARVRDLDESDALFGRALDLAVRHDLTLSRIRLLFHLGAQAAIRSADPVRLTEARSTALESGAVVTALVIAAELAVVHLTRAEFDEAERYARHCADTAHRLQLGELRLVGLGMRVAVAAHRGRRTEATELLGEFDRLGGHDFEFAAAVWGCGLAFCSLLEEDRDRALVEVAHAAKVEANRPSQYLSFAHGPRLLLTVLAGEAGRAEHRELAASASGQARWNRQFLALAEAVLAGRAGDAARADAAVRDFRDAARPYPLARHLGLRLLGEAAVDDGWGQPGPWLRAAEAYFHSTSAARVVSACRALLRRAGEPVPQRRRGTEAIPARLRQAGVTAREYEVLTLVSARLSNREIGERLFLSPRTVETHVANLLAKTGATSRAELAVAARGAESP